MSGSDVAGVAGLFADRSRAAMVELLLDGRDHSVRSLARAAGVASSTATEHVGRLEAGGVVRSRRDGRERLVRLAGGEAATAYEALAELSRERPIKGLREWTRHQELRAARTCYDHLAGKLGVAIADAALAAGAITPDFSLGPSAASWFARLGVEVDSLPHGRRRPLLRVCNDWTERREHLAGMLGAAICASMLSTGWVVRRPTSRALVVTPEGEASLGRLGIEVVRRCPNDMPAGRSPRATTASC
jgi:DNA-binding transcriptional ArsR family regulator